VMMDTNHLIVLNHIVNNVKMENVTFQKFVNALMDGKDQIVQLQFVLINAMVTENVFVQEFVVVLKVGLVIVVIIHQH